MGFPVSDFNSIVVLKCFVTAILIFELLCSGIFSSLVEPLAGALWFLIFNWLTSVEFRKA
jgi:hypothetical protein